MLTFKTRKEIREDVHKAIIKDGDVDDRLYSQFVEKQSKKLKRLIEDDCWNPDVIHHEHWFLAYWIKIESITYSIEYASRLMRNCSSRCESRWAKGFIEDVM